MNESRAEGRFLVRCFYHVPTYSDSDIHDTWKTEIVGFDQLILDVQRQQAYFFDYQNAYKEAVLRQEENCKVILRESFEQFWYDLDKVQKYTEELDARYAGLYRAFHGMGVEMPDSYHDRRFQSIIYILLSAKYGKVIGFKLSLIQVAHLTFDKYKNILWYFGKVINYFGYKQLLDLEDKSGKWKSRIEEIKTKMRERSPEYLRDTRYESIFKFLFPQIKINA